MLVYISLLLVSRPFKFYLSPGAGWLAVLLAGKPKFRGCVRWPPIWRKGAPEIQQTRQYRGRAWAPETKPFERNPCKPIPPTEQMGRDLKPEGEKVPNKFLNFGSETFLAPVHPGAFPRGHFYSLTPQFCEFFFHVTKWKSWHVSFSAHRSRRGECVEKCPLTLANFLQIQQKMRDKNEPV